MASVPDVTYNLLVNEIVKYAVCADSGTSVVEALRLVNKDEMAEKRQVVKEMGVSVGERIISFIVKEHVWTKENNSLMRFICKEFWMYLFGRYIGRLQSNGKGVYIMYDYKFHWFQGLDMTDSMDRDCIEKYCNITLSWVCGVLKGAFKGIGRDASIEAAIEENNSCKFTITLRV
jgi:trafficking protein particle complex subunit 6